MNYQYIQNPHPGVTSYKARKIAKKVLKKSLPSQAVIHHIDGDAFNNKHTNLVICEDQAYHGLLHRRINALIKYGDVHKQEQKKKEDAKRYTFIQALIHPNIHKDLRRLALEQDSTLGELLQEIIKVYLKERR